MGSYEIVSPLGSGGMGEVYRAYDVTLNREVAVKVLPEPLAHDRDRLARLKREAQLLAALNHPNIAAIYGFEHSDGVEALVLELVDGPTLADRIAQGRLPLDEALSIAGQIADAVAAAHEQGIIHRDLKPANIKVRPDGAVKVLDFGLGKAMDPISSAPDASRSPTVTSPVMTGMGVILGTAAYMSPEQARGKAVNKRADIWAFGCVLFEMLTGKRAFDGEDVSDTLAAVLRADPDWSVLPHDTPFPVRTLLRGCLEKDARQRIADISAALFVLRYQATSAPIAAIPTAGHDARSDVRRVAIFASAALMFGAAAAGAAVWLLTRTAPPSVIRTTISTSGATALAVSGVDRDVTITPDGSRVVYRGNNQLLVRALNQLHSTVLSGVGVPQGVFISPDGQWVGFFDEFAAIKRVSINGGPPAGVCAVGPGVPAGATWGPDGTIVFAMNASGLQRVSAAGGEPTVLTKVDRERGERAHAWPEFLPGGKAVLFTIIPATSGIDNAQVAVLDLATGTFKVLIRGSHAQYVPTGHLVYGLSGTLRAVAFDLARLEVQGTPVSVLDGVVTTPVGAADVAVAANGSLVYVAGGAGGGSRQVVVSVDRQGRASPLPGVPVDAYTSLRVSPDGTRLALATREAVSIYDFARGTLNRLTTNPGHNSNPLWTPDGQGIIFTSTRAGYPELFSRHANGTGADERLLARARDLFDLLADSWSKDRRKLLFSEVPPRIQCTIGQMDMANPSDVKLLVATGSSCNYSASVSPDGRSVAYTSVGAARSQIYIEPYPELGDRQLISTSGDVAVWSRDGGELFFISRDARQMFAVPMQSGTTLVAGHPQLLFELAMLPTGGGFRAYDVALDGRFVIIRSAEGQADAGAEPQIVFVQNWFEELKRLLPTK